VHLPVVGVAGPRPVPCSSGSPVVPPSGPRHWYAPARLVSSGDPDVDSKLATCSAALRSRPDRPRSWWCPSGSGPADLHDSAAGRTTVGLRCCGRSSRNRFRCLGRCTVSIVLLLQFRSHSRPLGWGAHLSGWRNSRRASLSCALYRAWGSSPRTPLVDTSHHQEPGAPLSLVHLQDGV
jgi:hypothetical protein